MKASHFYYSKEQEDLILDFEPEKEFPQVFINGKWVVYTEVNSVGNSNFRDAQHLGIHPRWWIKCNGFIQDNDLDLFIKQGYNKQ
jgi:hypothetical protein